MKLKSILIFLLTIISVAVMAQHKYIGYFNVGTPVRPTTNSESINGSIDIGITREIGSRFNLGVGAVYSQIDLNRGTNVLTYDRNLVDFYLRTGVKLELTRKVSFIPALRVGYSFFKYKLNGFSVGTETTGGFSVTPEAMLAYNIIEKLSLHTGMYLHTAFTRLQSHENFDIPTIYFKTYDEPVRQLQLFVGVAYTF